MRVRRNRWTPDVALWVATLIGTSVWVIVGWALIRLLLHWWC